LVTDKKGDLLAKYYSVLIVPEAGSLGVQVATEKFKVYSSNSGRTDPKIR
jgi:hypothetical protein